MMASGEKRVPCHGRIPEMTNIEYALGPAHLIRTGTVKERSTEEMENPDLAR